jgi:hypothetical protein
MRLISISVSYYKYCEIQSDYLVLHLEAISHPSVPKILKADFSSLSIFNESHRFSLPISETHGYISHVARKSDWCPWAEYARWKCMFPHMRRHWHRAKLNDSENGRKDSTTTERKKRNHNLKTIRGLVSCWFATTEKLPS